MFRDLYFKSLRKSYVQIFLESIVYWYVLFVRTAYEERVMDMLEKHLDCSIHKPFIPKKVWPFVKGKDVKKEIKICFPGYVFIKSQMNSINFIQDVFPVIRTFKEVFYFLHYGEDKYDITLRPDECRSIECLINPEFSMDSSIGFIEGDRVKVISGPLLGMESKIVKINKRKRTAVIDIDILGAKRHVTLMLEIIEKCI